MFNQTVGDCQFLEVSHCLVHSVVFKVHIINIPHDHLRMLAKPWGRMCLEFSLDAGMALAQDIFLDLREAIPDILLGQ
jgi:hypothetical protein